MRSPFAYLLGSLLLFAAAPAAHAQTSSTPSDAEKIADASRAGPAELVANATMLDWPATPDGDFRVLRQGSNGWVCLPDHPQFPNDEPMCHDEQWLDWLRSFLRGEPPRTSGLGLSYMLNTTWAGSNTDPMATKPTSDNQWHEMGSHLMLIAPDPKMLDAFPDEPRAGEPYVMWKGTPFAHVMIPVPEAHAGAAEAGAAQHER